eukprot:GSChrysophyteH1.ASY1.ANO1.977.1 assembled CDS
MLRNGLRLLAAPAAAVGTYVAVDPSHRYEISSSLSAMSRIARLVSTVVVIAIDYKITLADIEFNRGNAFQSEGKLARCHSRNAVRVRDMCAANRGVYIKIGQHLAMLDYVLPEQYTATLSSLLAQSPRSSWDDVRAVLREDFGATEENDGNCGTVFDSIDQEPIASASLAQVHIAYKDGRKLAVKVQHRGLREESLYDMKAITQCVEAISKLFEDFEYTWLTPAKNLEYYIKRGDLTADVARLVSTVFCEQIYRHGFVHCDPHDGNILVRPHANQSSRPTMVLLDHGLYRRLDPHFHQIKASCINMHVGPAYTLLAAILTMRPWDDIVNEDRTKIEGKISKSDAEMLKVYAEKYFKDIVQLLGRVDSDMLLLLKTNDCLRHLDKKLKSPVNTLKIVANITGDVLIREELWPVVSNTPRKEEAASGDGRLEKEKKLKEFKREHYSEVYKAAAKHDKMEPQPVQQERPDGVMFWLHPRTQSALYKYVAMQLKGVQLYAVDWYLWFMGGK